MRISATNLESFRLWSSEDWMTTEKMIASIRHTEPESEAMRIGSAWDAIMGRPGAFRTEAGDYQANGYVFAGDGVLEAVDGLPYESGVCQVKTTEPIGGHTVVCVADMVSGLTGYEHKATLNPFDADKYLHSLQWRVMVSGLGLTRLIYRVAEWGQPASGGRMTLKSLHSLSVFPYPAMREELESWVSRFAEFAESHGLAGYLEERAAHAAGQLTER